MGGENNTDHSIRMSAIEIEENTVNEENEIEFCESIMHIFFMYYRDSIIALICGTLYVVGLIWSFVVLDIFVLQEFVENESEIDLTSMKLYAIPLYILSLLFGSCIVTQITLNLCKAVVWAILHNSKRNSLYHAVHIAFFWCTLYFPILIGGTMASTLVLKIMTENALIEGFALLIDISVLMTIEEELPKYLQIKVPDSPLGKRGKSLDIHKTFQQFIEKDDFKNPANLRFKRGVIVALYCGNLFNMLWVCQYLIVGFSYQHYSIAPIYTLSIQYLLAVALLAGVAFTIYSIFHNPTYLIRSIMVTIAWAFVFCLNMIKILYVPSSKLS